MDAEHDLKLGRYLSVTATDRQLILITKPTRPILLLLLRVGIQLGPIAVLVFAVLSGVHTLVINVIQGSTSTTQAMPTLIGWFIPLFASVMIAVLFSSVGKRSRIRLRLGLRGRVARTFAGIGGGDPDDIFSIKVSHRNVTVSRVAPRSEYFNLRVQQDGVEDIPHGEHARVQQGRGEWWLRFETSNYEPWCINLALDNEHAQTLADLVTEAVGLECIVVRRIDRTPAETQDPLNVEAEVR